jgi:transposase-like protein
MGSKVVVWVAAVRVAIGHVSGYVPNEGIVAQTTSGLEHGTLHCAMNSQSHTLGCMLSAARDADAAVQGFRKVLGASHPTRPCLIGGDKNVAYQPAFEALQQEGTLPEGGTRRQCQYLNNVAEQNC